MAFGDEADRERNTREILGRNIDEAIKRGDLRSHEREHAIDIAREIFHGNVTNGEATDKAIRIVKKGL